MSTQQSAQQRAAAFAYKHHCESEYNSRTDDLEGAFLAGETSGYQIAMDEMSAKSAEGFEDWYDKRSILRAVIKTYEPWQAGRAPLLAKIAELEKEVATIRSAFNHCGGQDLAIDDLEAQNKKLGDVVLDMAKAVDGDDGYKKWLGLNPDSHFSEDHLAVIKQLKQERGNE
jgi:hypothetical protein